jgi:hypothetical protein
MKSYKKALLITICIFSCVSILSGSTPAFDQTGKTANEDKINLQIEEWLILGPVSTPFPAFNEEKKDEANDQASAKGKRPADTKNFYLEKIVQEKSCTKPSIVSPNTN